MKISGPFLIRNLSPGSTTTDDTIGTGTSYPQFISGASFIRSLVFV